MSAVARATQLFPGVWASSFDHRYMLNPARIAEHLVGDDVRAPQPRPESIAGPAVVAARCTEPGKCMRRCLERVGGCMSMRKNVC